MYIYFWIFDGCLSTESNQSPARHSATKIPSLSPAKIEANECNILTGLMSTVSVPKYPDDRKTSLLRLVCVTRGKLSGNTPSHFHFIAFTCSQVCRGSAHVSGLCSAVQDLASRVLMTCSLLCSVPAWPWYWMHYVHLYFRLWPFD